MLLVPPWLAGEERSNISISKCPLESAQEHGRSWPVSWAYEMAGPSSREGRMRSENLDDSLMCPSQGRVLLKRRLYITECFCPGGTYNQRNQCKLVFFGRIMVTQRYPYPGPSYLWLCYFTGQRGNEAVDGIKIADYLTLKEDKIISAYPSGPDVTTRVLKSGWEAAEEAREVLCEKDLTSHCCLEEGGRGYEPSQGMQSASGSWKRQRNKFSPPASWREDSPVDTDVNPGRPGLDI